MYVFTVFFLHLNWHVKRIVYMRRHPPTDTILPECPVTAAHSARMTFRSKFDKRGMEQIVMTYRETVCAKLQTWAIANKIAKIGASILMWLLQQSNKSPTGFADPL